MTKPTTSITDLPKRAMGRVLNRLDPVTIGALSCCSKALEQKVRECSTRITDLPRDPMSLILNRLDFVTVMTLRSCSKALKQKVDECWQARFPKRVALQRGGVPRDVSYQRYIEYTQAPLARRLEALGVDKSMREPLLRLFAGEVDRPILLEGEPFPNGKKATLSLMWRLVGDITGWEIEILAEGIYWGNTLTHHWRLLPDGHAYRSCSNPDKSLVGTSKRSGVEWREYRDLSSFLARSRRIPGTLQDYYAPFRNLMNEIDPDTLPSKMRETLYELFRAVYPNVKSVWVKFGVPGIGTKRTDLSLMVIHPRKVKLLGLVDYKELGILMTVRCLFEGGRVTETIKYDGKEHTETRPVEQKSEKSELHNLLAARWTQSK